jgi:4-hydroxy-tetrahydrodipicolinate synthase
MTNQQKRNTMKNPLRGIVPPMLTPLLDRDTLDVPGLERHVEHLVHGGVHGIFVLGTTGEGPSLGYRLRRELVERAVRLVRGRVPVLVGITDTAFVESVGLARHAAESGADAVVLAPPYYMPEGQPELREYLGHLLPELPLPLFLYNMPPLTKVPFELETIDWALDQPGILGLKDSSGNMIYFNQVLGLRMRRPDWAVLVGPEQLLAESVLMGGDGGVPGGGNIFPRLYVSLYEAARAGDLARARDLQARVQQVVDRLYQVGRHPSAIIKGIKCAVACLGVCGDFMAEPFHRFRPPERARIQQAIAELRGVVGDAVGPE